ncbi:MAG: hypothetical protein SFZ03_11980 [Candidatus Melainabacteria bacterium]|nr:hypothetical protein [Candidatus Melainabacteria bacterium]
MLILQARSAHATSLARQDSNQQVGVTTHPEGVSFRFGGMLLQINTPPAERLRDQGISLPKALKKAEVKAKHIPDVSLQLMDAYHQPALGHGRHLRNDELLIQYRREGTLTKQESIRLPVIAALSEAISPTPEAQESMQALRHRVCQRTEAIRERLNTLLNVLQAQSILLPPVLPQVQTLLEKAPAEVLTYLTREPQSGFQEAQVLFRSPFEGQNQPGTRRLHCPVGTSPERSAEEAT